MFLYSMNQLDQSTFFENLLDLNYSLLPKENFFLHKCANLQKFLMSGSICFKSPSKVIQPEFSDFGNFLVDLND
jgi:hypothetical protein